VGVKEDATNAVIFGTFPNPMTTQLVIQYYMYKAQTVTMQVFDMQGKKVLDKTLGKRDIGLNYSEMDVTSLKPGTYVLAIQMPDKVYKRFVVKM
jgi:hypothetical protein